MTVANFTETEALTGGGTFFVSTPFSETKSTDLKVKIASFLWPKWNLFGPMSFGEAKSTDTRALGYWTVGRTQARRCGRVFEKTLFRNPYPRIKSTKKGVAKNARTLCVG